MGKRFELNLDDEDKIKSDIRKALNWTGQIDGLVNCAGIAQGSMFSMTRMADLKKVFQVNLFGQLFLTQYVVKKMLRAKSGSIVNLSSTASLFSDRGTLAYGGAKAALNHATRVMAAELGPMGIRVNAIAPSAIQETSMAAQMDEANLADLSARAALGRAPRTDDVAYLVAYLLSDKSKMISGQILRVDGGMML